MGCSQSSTPSSNSRKLPKFLPKPGPVNQVLAGSIAHPTLGIEGDTMALDLPHGHVAALLVGPQVPESGAAPIPNYTDALFQLTLSRVSGSVPLSSLDFNLTDELGRVTHPQLIPSQGPITTVGPVPTGPAATALGPVPTMVVTGQTVTVDLVDAQIGVGDCQLAWAPGTGGHVVATWAFSVEVD